MPEADRETWPGATELVSTLVTLPTHSLVTAGERRAILQLLERYRPLG